MLVLLLVGEGLASEQPANPASAESPQRVEFENNRLSVEVDSMLLVDLLKIIGDQADIKLVVIGDIDLATGPWSFTELPITSAIARLLRGTNAIVSEDKDQNNPGDTRIKSIFLLGPGTGETLPVDTGQLDSSTAAQPVAPQLQPGESDQQQEYLQVSLLRQTLSGDLSSRIEAINRLQGLSDEVTLTQLNFALSRDPDPEVRARAVEMLAQIGGTNAASALEEGLGDDNAEVRKLVVESLGQTRDDRVSLWLGQVLIGDESADVRLQAVEALAHQKGPTARIFLQVATQDQSQRVSAAATRLLE